MKTAKQRRGGNKPGIGKSSKKPMTRTPIEDRIPKQTMQIIAYVMIGGAAVASWFLTPVPVAAGFTILAAVRTGLAIREQRKQGDGLQNQAACPANAHR